MKCSNCGCENSRNAKFCKQCGNKLETHSMAYQDMASKINKNNSQKSSFLSKYKVLIIAIIIVLIVAGAACAFVLSQTHYKNISVIGVTMEVPDSDSDVNIQSDSYSTYVDNKNHVSVYGLDTSESFGYMSVFESVRAAYNGSVNLIDSEGIPINKSSNGTVTYYGCYGSKHIFIVANDDKILTDIVKSIQAPYDDSDDSDFDIDDSDDEDVDDDVNSSEEINSSSVNDSDDDVEDLEILGGSISTGSSLSSKTHADIYVGEEHAGEKVKVTAVYSSEGAVLNKGNILPRTVDSSGYVSFSSAKAFKKYPDTAIIYLYDKSGDLLDTRTVYLEPDSGTQTF